MSLLDDLKRLAGDLPESARVTADDVIDVISAVVHTLDKQGVQAAAPPAAVTADNAHAVDDGTEGSTVYDVAGQGSAEPESSASVDEQIKAQEDALQALYVQRADAQKTQHSAEND